MTLKSNGKLMVPKDTDPTLKTQINLKRSVIVAELIAQADPPVTLLEDGAITGFCKKCGCPVTLTRYAEEGAGDWAWYECPTCEDVQAVDVSLRRLWWGQVWGLGWAMLYNTKLGADVCVLRDKGAAPPEGNTAVTYELAEVLIAGSYPEEMQWHIYESKVRTEGRIDVGEYVSWDASTDYVAPEFKPCGSMDTIWSTRRAA